jgi:hypothetical protein
MKISKKILGLFLLLFATVLLASCGEADLAPTLAGVETRFFGSWTECFVLFVQVC